MKHVPTQSGKYLVTGAAGFIGSHTVDLLVKEGNQVLGIDNLSSGNRTNLTMALNSGRFRLEEMDVLNSVELERVVGEFQPDAIIHLAGLVSVALGQKIPQKNFDLNVNSTQIVAEAARKHGIKRIVFASSAAVYGDLEQLPIKEDMPQEPKSNYGSAKLISEILLQGYARSYGITAVCNRFFNVFGPRQDPGSPYSGVISIFTDRFSQGLQAKIYGDGQQSRDFISVYDVARGLVLSATREDVPSGAYNLCTGKRQSLLNLVDALRTHFPDAPPIHFESERAGDIKHSQGSHQKARFYLGFEPSVTFEDAIADLVASLDDDMLQVA